MVFTPLIYLDGTSDLPLLNPQKLVAGKVNQRSENHRFGLDVRVGGWAKSRTALALPTQDQEFVI